VGAYSLVFLENIDKIPPERKVRMVWLRRAIGVIFATAIAIGAGLVFLPVAALADPVTCAAGFALIQFAVWALADADIVDGVNGGGLAALTRFVWMAVVTVCVVPVVAVASIGEIARVRVLSWYAGATGVAAASAPWLIRATLHLPRAAGYNCEDFTTDQLKIAQPAISPSRVKPIHPSPGLFNGARKNHEH